MLPWSSSPSHRRGPGTEVVLSFVFNEHTCPACDVTIWVESEIYIFQMFANNLKTKRDRVMH